MDDSTSVQEGQHFADRREDIEHLRQRKLRGAFGEVGAVDPLHRVGELARVPIIDDRQHLRQTRVLESREQSSLLEEPLGDRRTLVARAVDIPLVQELERGEVSILVLRAPHRRKSTCADCVVESVRSDGLLRVHSDFNFGQDEKIPTCATALRASRVGHRNAIRHRSIRL